MASGNKKMIAAVNLPECPVCMEPMSAPIFQCQTGHSLCNVCTINLRPAICPICRQQMTRMRNWQLEDIISKAKVPCPNREKGCTYSLVGAEVEDHVKECIFRIMSCPLGVVFGKCSWNGQLKQLGDHLKQSHPEHCNVAADTDVEIENIDVHKDDRYVYIVNQGKLIFILTVKLDTSHKMAFWTVQLIGSKNAAMQHVYEIHITSQVDSRRKVIFIDHCFNDAIRVEEIFSQGKCVLLPLDSLNHFIKNKKMSFRFLIKRMPSIKKDSTHVNNNIQPKNKSTGNKQPHFARPNGAKNQNAHASKHKERN